MLEIICQLSQLVGFKLRSTELVEKLFEIIELNENIYSRNVSDGQSWWNPSKAQLSVIVSFHFISCVAILPKLTEALQTDAELTNFFVSISLAYNVQSNQ